MSGTSRDDRHGWRDERQALSLAFFARARARRESLMPYVCAKCGEPHADWRAVCLTCWLRGTLLDDAVVGALELPSRSRFLESIRSGVA